MDKIIIRGLEVEACHGVNGDEKINPQPFVFDVDLYFDCYEAAQSDDIKDTVNYSTVSKKIAEVTKNNCFNLIEKLAYECAYAIIELYEPSRIVLTVHKPQAPMKLKFQSVGVTVDLSRETVFLSLGSSMGDREKYLNTALDKLYECKGLVHIMESVFEETAPYGGVAKNKFLNCVAMFKTWLTPRQLLNVIHKIEKECGRDRSVHWGDRTLDIDIIFFGKREIMEDDLIIPHPEYHKRDFVLNPLKQLAPDFICPKFKKPIREI